MSKKKTNNSIDIFSEFTFIIEIYVNSDPI